MTIQNAYKKIWQLLMEDGLWSRAVWAPGAIKRQWRHSRKAGPYLLWVYVKEKIYLTLAKMVKKTLFRTAEIGAKTIAIREIDQAQLQIQKRRLGIYSQWAGVVTERTHGVGGFLLNWPRNSLGLGSSRSSGIMWEMVAGKGMGWGIWPDTKGDRIWRVRDSLYTDVVRFLLQLSCAGPMRK